MLCLGGPYHRLRIALLPSLIIPPFSDLPSYDLLLLTLARYSYISSNPLCFQSRFSSVASNCISTGHYEKKRFLLFCNVLLMFPLYLKTLDGVALCLLYLLVYDLCLRIQPEISLSATRYLILFYFFWFVRGTYISLFIRLFLY